MMDGVMMMVGIHQQNQTNLQVVEEEVVVTSAVKKGTLQENVQVEVEVVVVEETTGAEIVKRKDIWLTTAQIQKFVDIAVKKAT